MDNKNTQLFPFSYCVISLNDRHERHERALHDAFVGRIETVLAADVVRPCVSKVAARSDEQPSDFLAVGLVRLKLTGL